MRTSFFSLVLMTLAFGTSAQASTFVIDYETRAAADPAQDFEADCLGATEAADCASRAAALSSELVELLSSLEGRRDADTIALFQAAAALDDPKLAELGVRYFSHYGQTPPTVWDNVKEFFFGTDPGLGAASAELLTESSNDADVALGEHYLRGRPSYGSWIPAAGADDEWASAQARDALFDAMLAFEESEQFTPATRLLMNDRTLTRYSDPNGDIPVTGFVTDSPLPDVTAFFTQLFGKAPYASLADSEAKLQQLNQELEGLQVKLQTGDQAAVKRLLELTEELTPVQAAVSLAGMYEFEDQQCTDHVFWVDADPEAAYGGTVPRAVAIGQDRLIGRTAIRYINGLRAGAPPPADDDPDAGADGDADGGSDEDARDTRKGGGCSVHSGAPQGDLWLVVIGASIVGYVRRRRGRR